MTHTIFIATHRLVSAKLAARRLSKKPAATAETKAVYLSDKYDTATLSGGAEKLLADFEKSIQSLPEGSTYSAAIEGNFGKMGRSGWIVSELLATMDACGRYPTTLFIAGDGDSQDPQAKEDALALATAHAQTHGYEAGPLDPVSSEPTTPVTSPDRPKSVSRSVTPPVGDTKIYAWPNIPLAESQSGSVTPSSQSGSESKSAPVTPVPIESQINNWPGSVSAPKNSLEQEATLGESSPSSKPPSPLQQKGMFAVNKRYSSITLSPIPEKARKVSLQVWHC